MSKYVVTGGAGFIGSATVRELLQEADAEVVVIDNLLSGKRANLAEVLERISLVVADIRDYDTVLKHARGADVVFHLAAIPSVPRSISDPVPSHDVNVNGTFSVFRAAADAKARRVVYAASSSAYGDTEVLPKVETMRPLPKSPYAAQKLMGEYYAQVFQNCFGLETVALRYFNVYGPRQDPNSPYSGVISVFMKSLLTGKAPTIFGDGGQTRDFTYVEDVARLNAIAGREAAAAGKLLNAGNGYRYTLNDIWDALQRIAGISLAAKYADARAGDVRDSQADITAIREALPYRPEFDLEDGLRRTFEWYRAQSAER
ncbi:MAG: NAD-dependent epimerase/dehydratase family protein [Bryobacterales bacterium]|nr:NAD-dependent epimerase/dehydratase family protein [Bryobacterales bacterium]